MKQVARFKFMYRLRLIRNGQKVYEFKRERDLLTWRGMMVLAGLISQGQVGCGTSAWKVYASGNAVTPDVGDDSGDPTTNELNPLLGTPASVVWQFDPSVKVTGQSQFTGTLQFTGDVTINSNSDIKKIGVIDTGTPPNQYIVVEDAVVPTTALAGDIAEITYFVQFG